MKVNPFPQKPVPEASCCKARDMEVQLDGVTYQVGIFLPKAGTGCLESRLLRLMEGRLDQ